MAFNPDLSPAVPVLDHGFVRLIDVMGSDKAIVEAARVSYATGTKVTRKDRDLIRYLLRQRHTSPFEMAEVKFIIKAPIFVARQWVRHRTACLSGDTVINFDQPSRVKIGRRKAYPVTIKEIYDRFQPTQNLTRPDKQANPFFKRDRLKAMLLRSCDESSNVPYHTRIVDIWQSGVKPLIRVNFSNGDFIRATADHRCYTDKGWLPLKDALAQNARFARFGKSTGFTSEAPVFSDDEIANEVWVPAKQMLGYEVSSLGRVRSFRKRSPVRGKNNPTPKMKTLTVNPQGYSVVGFSENGKTLAFHVSRLVLESFGHVWQEGQQCRHLDNNRQNNRLTNLGFGSAKENCADRMTTGVDQTLGVFFEHPSSHYEDGEEMTYDISVSGPYHNFSAGNTVVHNSVNENSGRYSVMDTEFFTPDYEDIAYQSATNNQGRSEPLPLCRAIPIRQAIAYSSEQSFGAYNNMLVEDVARETARIVLPLNTYTSWVWKIDLHNLLHFLQLRADPHAQKEIRDYAEVIIGLLAPLFPATFEAWEDYVRQAVTFSRMEMDLLGAVMRRFTSPSASLYALIDEHRGIDNLGAAYGMSKREIREFFGKVKVVVPPD